MMQQYQDSMAIVARHGRPDLFITMTCNPNWKEIQENLFLHQTAADRPDIIPSENLVLNRTSLQQLRETNRHYQYGEAKSEFIDNLSNNNRLVVHWDGKILADLVGRFSVDRIAVTVSYNGTSKFLGAPKIESGTGENIAQAVYNTLVEWEISGNVVAASFDTTSSNTGLERGACIILDDFLDRKPLRFACRHHICEILLKDVFEKKYGKSNAPETLIFNRFADMWHNIEQGQFNYGIDDQIVTSKISDDECAEIKQFCRNQLQKSQIRGDYKELLELTITFLGENVGPFRTCGATSHARFMSKAIYCLKIFLFRDQFDLTARELNCIRDISIFVVKLYIKAWYGCTNPIECPNQDLNFLHEAFDFSKIDKVESQSVIEKFKNHLWYLTPETVGLAFFDPNVSFDIKRKMVNRRKAKNPTVVLIKHRTFPNVQHLLTCDLSDFVSH
ncbi:uncharacterized protein LOC122507578 [Leptopilina heterotoma]|uniref:uncharacterized protein LOC122507578 n=1 Tax=Leptopilina heterotoma TaxID=63436 RepID=UPI001CA913DA|nr:uncharacterized protein LOC122507578 [Leptopilina heterotoma]